MKKSFILFSFLLVFCPVFGQKALPEFGVIDKADLQLLSCSFEPDAVAMKLFDVRESEFEPSPFAEKIRTERRVRIKIFNEKGFSFASVKIPYYSNKKSTKATDLKGIVYSLDAQGTIVTHKIEESDFFKDKAAQNVGLLSFTFPDVRPGSVIEYSYTLTKKGDQIDTWVLSDEIPTIYSSNSIIIPAYSNFKEYILGNEPISKKTETIKKGLDRNKTIFYKENIPSLKPEPYMSSYKDNALRMAFVFFPRGNPFLDNISSLSLWKMVANQILKSSILDEQFNKIILGTEKIIDTALGMRYAADKIKYLYRAVKRRIPEKQEQASFPDDIGDAWKSRSGSAAEINMILMNLLKRSGVNCWPVLVSTRENGKVNLDFPSFSQFNGMDILVKEANGTTYLIDASLRFQPYNIPPINILNRQIFILDPDNIRWALLSDDRPLLKQTTNVFATLTKDGIIEASATVNYFDYAKSLFLDSSIVSTDNKDTRFIDKKIVGLKILSDNRENMGDGEPFIQTIEFDYDTQESGEFLFINPQLLALKKANPFILDKRNTDIDFGCNQMIQVSMHLGIPDNFQVENLPKNMIVRSPDSNFAFTRITYSDKSNISFSQTLEIKKSIFDRNEYAGLYEFFKRIFALMAEEIILKKKK